jgi:hypothetical protein
MEDHEENEKTETYENENTENSKEIREALAQLLGIIENASEILQKNNEDAEAFRKRLNELWKDPFDLLELFLMLSTEAGAKFNRDNRPIALEQNGYVFEALTRLHAKACLIGQEIITLMKNGYASGAHARWRSLHEITVTASFIKDHGNEVAERYLLYDRIEVYTLFKDYLKDNDLYKKHTDTLGYTPYGSLEEMKEAEISKKRLCDDNKFGKSFGDSYGWAAKALGNRPHNFKEIEKDVKLDHLRPFYNMANHFVHAGPRGIYFNIGISDSHDENILLAGHSDSGLADPGSNMAVSLYYMNKALLTTRPTVENLIFLRVAGLLVDEINDELLKVHKFIEEQTEGKALPIKYR